MDMKVLLVQVYCTRLTSCGQLSLISDPLMVSKFHNRIHDPKGKENEICAYED